MIVATTRGGGAFLLESLAMTWEELPDSERAAVFAVLEREADRLEQDAAQLQQAAQRLGRPSLVARQELAANAFRAALELLTRPAK